MITRKRNMERTILGIKKEYRPLRNWANSFLFSISYSKLMCKAIMMMTRITFPINTQGIFGLFSVAAAFMVLKILFFYIVHKTSTNYILLYGLLSITK